MEFRESESIELKRMYIDDIRKEVIAIARFVKGVFQILTNF